MTMRLFLYGSAKGGDSIDWSFVALKSLEVSGELRREW